MGTKFLNFLDSYLSPRIGQVVVQGTFSDTFEIANSVFQGTVLGPPLWNTFFSDVSAAASSTGGRGQMFADDLNVFQSFDTKESLEKCQSELERCRKRVHSWGRANRVAFDESKEHVVILHPSQHHGQAFKLLGCMIDVDLRMHSAIDQVLSKIKPKVIAILRTRGYYDTPDLILQFKTHIWSLIEGNIGGYFHAAESLLEKIDKVQSNFVGELGLSLEQAFLEYNFPPPRLRRNVGVLGLLQKRVLGKCHPSFNQLLPWRHEYFSEPRLLGHSKQLYGHNCEITNHQALFNRSIFAMVDIYNNLPQYVIDASSVSLFQKYLMQIVRFRCKSGDPAWTASFSRLAEHTFEESGYN